MDVFFSDSEWIKEVPTHELLHSLSIYVNAPKLQIPSYHWRKIVEKLKIRPANLIN